MKCGINHSRTIRPSHHPLLHVTDRVSRLYASNNGTEFFRTTDHYANGWKTTTMHTGRSERQMLGGSNWSAFERDRFLFALLAWDLAPPEGKISSRWNIGANGCSKVFRENAKLLNNDFLTIAADVKFWLHEDIPLLKEGLVNFLAWYQQQGIR